MVNNFRELFRKTKRQKGAQKLYAGYSYIINALPYFWKTMKTYSSLKCLAAVDKVTLFVCLAKSLGDKN